MKDFIEYRRNKKTAKRELAKMMATTLPSLNKFGAGLSDVIEWIMRLIDSTKYVTTDHVLDYTIEQLAGALETNGSRLKQMATYIFSLSGEDITRIISAAAMETSPAWHVVDDDTDETDGSDD